MAIVKAGSFSRAAIECHVSQPSLSQQIIKLEEELGGLLFERLPRGVALTPAAHQLKKSAERILAEVDEAVRRVALVHGSVKGRVVVGVLPTIAPYLLPQALSAFARHYPDAEVVVQEDTTSRLLVALDTVEIDLAILSLPVEAPFLQTRVLFDDELLLALPEGHHLGEQQDSQLEALIDEKFILLQEGHCLADQTAELCRRSAHFHPKVVCRSAQIETVLAMIASGVGISLIPKMAARETPGVIYRSLVTHPHRRLVLGSRKNRHQCLVARAFYECLVSGQRWDGAAAPHSELESAA